MNRLEIFLSPLMMNCQVGPSADNCNILTKRLGLDDRLHTGYMTDTINDLFYNILANGVVPSSIVVRRIFFAFDQEFWVEEVAVSAMADFVDW